MRQNTEVAVGHVFPWKTKLERDKEYKYMYFSHQCRGKDNLTRKSGQTWQLTETINHKFFFRKWYIQQQKQDCPLIHITKANGPNQVLFLDLLDVTKMRTAPRLYQPEGRTSAPVFSSIVTRLVVRSKNKGWRWNRRMLSYKIPFWREIFYHKTGLQPLVRLHVLKC